MSRLRVVPDPWPEDQGAQAAVTWLQAYAYDMVALPVLDLLSVVARLEQVKDDPDADPVTFGRIFTCDLPRLRQYLPDGALEELDR